MSELKPLKELALSPADFMKEIIRVQAIVIRDNLWANRENILRDLANGCTVDIGIGTDAPTRLYMDSECVSITHYNQTLKDLTVKLIEASGEDGVNKIKEATRQSIDRLAESLEIDPKSIQLALNYPEYDIGIPWIFSARVLGNQLAETDTKEDWVEKLIPIIVAYIGGEEALIDLHELDESMIKDLNQFDADA